MCVLDIFSFDFDFTFTLTPSLSPSPGQHIAHEVSIHAAPESLPPKIAHGNVGGATKGSDGGSGSDGSSDEEEDDNEDGIEICSNLVHELVHSSRPRPVLVMADTGNFNHLPGDTRRRRERCSSRVPTPPWSF